MSFGKLHGLVSGVEHCSSVSSSSPVEDTDPLPVFGSSAAMCVRSWRVIVRGCSDRYRRGPPFDAPASIESPPSEWHEVLSCPAPLLHRDLRDLRSTFATLASAIGDRCMLALAASAHGGSHGHDKSCGRRSSSSRDCPIEGRDRDRFLAERHRTSRGTGSRLDRGPHGVGRCRDGSWTPSFTVYAMDRRGRGASGDSPPSRSNARLRTWSPL